MSPIPPVAQRTLQATGARRTTPGAPTSAQIISTLRELNRDASGFAALLDATAVAGERHLLSAWAHLGRSRAREQSRLRDRSAEFVLYVAGDDQLPRALAKVGVGGSTEEFVVVAERPKLVADVVRAFGLTEDPAVYPRAPTERTLERLGIEPAERAVVPRDGWEGLVLERVAFVDLSPSHGSDPTPARKPT